MHFLWNQMPKELILNTAVVWHAVSGNIISNPLNQSASSERTPMLPKTQLQILKSGPDKTLSNIQRCPFMSRMVPINPTWCHICIFLELIVNPQVVNTSVFKPFQIECVSHRMGIRPTVVFSSGANITLDGQFEILTSDPQKVIVAAPRGLSAVYNGMSIQ